MENQWIRADRLHPDIGRKCLVSINGDGIRIARYRQKTCVDGGYFEWDAGTENFVEDDLSQIAWRDLPEEYKWED